MTTARSTPFRAVADPAPRDEGTAMTLKHLAPTKKIHSFHPPQRTLMGPGPSEINPRVMAAMSLPAIGYLDPIFVEMMEELKSLLRDEWALLDAADRELLKRFSLFGPPGPEALP